MSAVNGPNRRAVDFSGSFLCTLVAFQSMYVRANDVRDDISVLLEGEGGLDNRIHNGTGSSSKTNLFTRWSIT